MICCLVPFNRQSLARNGQRLLYLPGSVHAGGRIAINMNHSRIRQLPGVRAEVLPGRSCLLAKFVYESSWHADLLAARIEQGKFRGLSVETQTASEADIEFIEDTDGRGVLKIIQAAVVTGAAICRQPLFPECDFRLQRVYARQAIPAQAGSLA